MGSVRMASPQPLTSCLRFVLPLAEVYAAGAHTIILNLTKRISGSYKLTNAPAILITLTNDIFYLKDTLIFNKTLEQPGTSSARSRESASSFQSYPSADYSCPRSGSLATVVDVDSNKIKLMIGWRPLSSLGSVIYCRCFILGYAKMGCAADRTAQELKISSVGCRNKTSPAGTLTNAPVLATFDPFKEISICTDVPQFAVGAALMQEAPPDAFHPTNCQVPKSTILFTNKSS
ncbi:hypothetical protein EDD21DRAFT_435938 [Dissophora ornata]|nr:hypothetical protein EDD21DRAFT_435938 [Dissophora ornata]